MKDNREMETYWREATTWDTDRIAQIRRTARIAWWTAGGGWLCAMLAGAALMLLMPLKRVEPFVIRVDNATGVVDVVPVYAGNLTADEAVTRYLLTHYITTCERFNLSTAESDYQECGAFHTAQMNESWYEQWTQTNQQSPLNLYKDGTTVRAQVTSVSFLKKANGISDLVQVRYTKAKRQGNGGEPEVTHWIATLQYIYVKPSNDPQTRSWNPLGFKITYFHPEPEVAAPQIATASTTMTDSSANGTKQ